MYSGPLRLVRALTVSATVVALSLAAHVLGAGSAESVTSVAAFAGLVMITVLLTLVLAACSGQRWTLGRSLVCLAAGQGCLNAIFTVLLSPHHPGPTALAGGASMALAHGVAALLIGAGIAVNDSALDTFFAVASAQVTSRITVLSPWRLATLIQVVAAATMAGIEGRGECFARWQRSRILTSLVVLQCLSRRGPPALALTS